MNTKDYISSGILELYAAGSLSGKEMREVDTVAEQYPEVRAELEAIQEAYNEYASLHKKTPPAGTKEKIMQRIDELVSEKKVDKNYVATEQRSVAGVSRYKYLAAAVVLLVLTNLVTNFLLYRKLSKTEDELTILISENKKLKNDNELIKQSLEKKTQDIMVISNRNNKIAEMKGTKNSPNSLAVVYWDTRTKQVYLNIEALPAPPPDKQYQLWALAGGKPVDAGVFDVTDKSQGLQLMKKIESAEAFAVTLEPKGGSPTPTLDAMYVIGNL